MPSKTKTTLTNPKEISEYEIRVKAMTLATQHSRNCQTSTLVKIAGSIYDFLVGKPASKTKDDE